jgi:hypothetical protein
MKGVKREIIKAEIDQERETDEREVQTVRGGKGEWS